MMRLSTLILPLFIASTLAACARQQADARDPAGEASASQALPPAEPVAVSSAAPAPAITPATAPAATPAVTSLNTSPAGNAFDPQSVSVTNVALPAFPYVATPAELEPAKVYTEKDIEFDRVFVVAGRDFRRVEGKVLHRNFFLHQLKWSPLAAHRNYEAALKALGATRVDAVHPMDDQFVARNGGNSDAVFKKMGIPSLGRMDDPELPGFEQWLIRTPSTNIWVSFFLHNNDGQLGLLVVEEKAMQQTVPTLPVVAATKS